MSITVFSASVKHEFLLSCLPDMNTFVCHLSPDECFNIFFFFPSISFPYLAQIFWHAQNWEARPAKKSHALGLE